MSARTAATGQTLPNTHTPLDAAGVPRVINASNTSGHALTAYGDKGLWDATSSAAVSVDNSTVGTTLCPKI